MRVNECKLNYRKAQKIFTLKFYRQVNKGDKMLMVQANGHQNSLNAM